MAKDWFRRAFLGGILGIMSLFAGCNDWSKQGTDTEPDVDEHSHPSVSSSSGVPVSGSKGFRFVSEGERLAEVIETEGQGTYYLEPGNFELDRVPEGVHIRGTAMQNVVVQTSDPVSVNLVLGPSASVGWLTLETAWAGATDLEPGDPREVGLHVNNANFDIDKSYWPEQSLNVHQGADGEKDRPGIASIGWGWGDSIYAWANKGNCYRAVAPTGSDAKHLYAARRDSEMNLQLVHYLDENGTAGFGGTVELLDADGEFREVLHRTKSDGLVVGRGMVNASGEDAGGTTMIVGNGASIRVYDADRGTDLFRATAGGSVEVPNQRFRPGKGSEASPGFGHGSPPEDLHGETGNFDGEIRVDDGSNTARRCIPCTWDVTDEVWVRPDGTTFV